jgi:opacity protein-like surface antigen
MRIRMTILMAFALLVAGAAFGQDHPRWEVPIDYTYARGYPANVAKPFSLNGGGGGIVFNFNKYVGIAMDLQGYASTTATFTNVLVVTPHSTGLTSFTASGNLLTYMAGPQVRLPHHAFQPFGEILFGGAHSSLYATAFTASGSVGIAPGNNAFAMAVGAGFDIRVNNSFKIRPFQMDYLLTRFGNPLLGVGTHPQNNFRYVGGVVFTFGG